MATGFTAAFSKSAARDQEQEDDYHPPFSMEGRPGRLHMTELPEQCFSPCGS